MSFMDIKTYDKTTCKILKTFLKKSLSPDVLQKTQDSFYAAIRGLSDSKGVILISAFEALRDYWHEDSRGRPEAYAQIVKELAEASFAKSADAVFECCVNSLSKLDRSQITNSLSSVRAVQLWVKAFRSSGARFNPS